MKKILGLMLLSLCACSSNPERLEVFSTDADPGVEISKSEARLQKARGESLDLLAPQTFEKSLKSLNRAKERWSSRMPASEVLRELSYANGWLTDAEIKGGVARSILSPALEEREKAIATKGYESTLVDFNKVDKRLLRVTRDMENGDFTNDDYKRDLLVDHYHQYRIKTLNGFYVGEARNNIDEAKDEGVKSISAAALHQAEEKYVDALNVIESNPDNEPAISKAAAEANDESKKLLSLVKRQAE